MTTKTRTTCSFCRTAPVDLKDHDTGLPICGMCYSDRYPACSACGTEQDVDPDALLCPSCKAKGY